MKADKEKRDLPATKVEKARFRDRPEKQAWRDRKAKEETQAFFKDRRDRKDRWEYRANPEEERRWSVARKETKVIKAKQA